MPAVRCPGSDGWGSGSTGAMRLRKPADTRNDAASTNSAAGADSAWMRMPPRLGPAMNVAARLP